MAGSSGTRLALDDQWVAHALDGVKAGAAPHRLLSRLDERQLCLSVVAGDGSDESWTKYSGAAERRAALAYDRMCPLVASGRSDEFFFVAYDVAEAQPLDPREMSTAECVGLLHGIGRGLEQAAAAGFYPAELSPDSVFVDPNRGAVLVDLGVAREALGNPPESLDRCAAWVAPEVLSGKEPTERSAVFSFGAIMYTLLTGASPPAGPPSLRALRPDLPEALAVVVSTAMAREPSRRYRTAAEARSLANILLQGDLGPAASMKPPSQRAAALRRRSAEAVAGPRRRRAKSAQGKPTARRERRSPTSGRPGAAAWSRVASQARALPLPLAASVLALGALAGFLLAGDGPAEPAPPQTFTRGGLQLQLPGDWSASAPVAGALAANPVDDPGSGLTLLSLDTPVEREEQGNPVRLGALEAWREPQPEAAGARAAVRYVVPTESGKVVATCRASARAAPGTLATCERVASTLRLRSATGLPIAAVVEAQQRWQREVRQLVEQRAVARRSLARADLPAGQRLAAEALGRVHDRAAGRFSALQGGNAVAQAARRTAASYRALALAADGESTRLWEGARARVRRSEAALRQVLAES
jgi:Protein kinase domain